MSSIKQMQVPNLSLVVLVGASGAGKSTFARKHFLPYEVLSSDVCRGLVSNHENDQGASKDAFEVLRTIASKRLARGLLTVVDATNVNPESRRPWVELARKFHCLPVAIVLNPPERVCRQHNRDRTDRTLSPHLLLQQRSQLRRSLRGLKREGFRHIHVLESLEEIDAAVLERVPLWNDRKFDHGPFDIIGDVHGCCDELEALLEKLEYERTALDPNPLWGDFVYRHPEGRRAFFVGDIVDRGPRVVDCLRLVRNMVFEGTALCVPGNHDMKLLRKLRGKTPQVTHGFAQTVAEIEAIPEESREPFCKELAAFLDALVSHYVLDDGKLVVAHAGMKQELQGRGSGNVREFALYGETTGETDEFGLPVRTNWAADYRGSAMVVYGHTPVPEPSWLNNTVNVDTGCVFGGKLTAMRYPEEEFVSIHARKVYCEPSRPFLLPSSEEGALSLQQREDDVLDAADVLGKRSIATRLNRSVTIQEANATAALEVMSRFAANPKWLIYLPPTMSPCETSSEPGMLEHPAEAFSYYRSRGLTHVICQEKHMGSRAVVVVCRDEEVARKRFGIREAESGIVYTRTGRPFFHDKELEVAFLGRLRESLTSSGFWESLETDWACLDCEIMPWSAKALELLRSQYASVGAAGRAALPAALGRLNQAAHRLQGDEVLQKLTERFENRSERIDLFTSAYRQYCWSVDGLEGLRLAPFHLLATEGKVHIDRDHLWHMETLAKICREDPQFLMATEHRLIDLLSLEDVDSGVAWWNDLTRRGGEGMVVKPLEWIVRGKKGWVQPAVKCRGKEYLRIIYGPDYDAPENLARLRSRGLGRKRALALQEFSLGIESLERFVRREPLRRVHECVFGVLALESEPIDPRL